MNVRKIKAVAVAAITLFILPYTLSANAVDYYADYDANNDGEINVRDVALINRVVTGKSVPANLNYIDVNQNDVDDDIEEYMTVIGITTA